MKNKGVILRVLISAILLVLLFMAVPFRRLSPLFGSINIAFAALMVLSVLIDRVFMAYKWRLLVQSMGIELPFLECVRSYLVGNFLGQFFPSSVGGDVVRVFNIDVDKSRRGDIAASVVVERLVAMIALVLMIIIASLCLILLSAGQYRKYLFIAGGMLILATGGFILSLYWLPTKWMDRSKNRFIQKLKGMADAYQLFRTRKKVLLIFLGLSFLEHLFPILGNYLTALTLGIAVNPWTFFVVIPMILLFSRLPISLDGLGVQEHLYMLIFPLGGNTAPEAVAIGLMLRFLTILASIPGGLLIAYAKRKKQSSINQGKKI